MLDLNPAGQSEKKRAPDPRPARTRHAICAAARDITRRGEDVSVNTIVKQAGVSRASFYAHFDGLDALAQAIVDRETTELAAKISTRLGAGIDARTVAHEFLRDSAVHLVRNRDFYRGFMTWPVSHRAYVVLVNSGSTCWSLVLDSLGDEVPAAYRNDISHHFLAGGIGEVLLQWLDAESSGNDEHDIEQLYRILYELLPDFLRHTPDSAEA